MTREPQLTLVDAKCAHLHEEVDGALLVLRLAHGGQHTGHQHYTGRLGRVVHLPGPHTGQDRVRWGPVGA